MITTFLRHLSKNCNGWQKAHLCGKFVYSSTWKRFQNGCEWSTCFHGAFSLSCRQWCSQNRNLRDRDFIRFPRLRLETSKFVHFAEIFFKMSLLLCWIFFKFLSFFRPVLVVSYLQIQQTKIRWIIKILLYQFFAIFKVSRPVAFKAETRPETF